MRSLYRHNVSGEPRDVDASTFCIVGLYEGERNMAGHGTVVGDMSAPRKIIVLNSLDAHFDPCAFPTMDAANLTFQNGRFSS